VQALFSCESFKAAVLDYSSKSTEDNLLDALSDLFKSLSSAKKKGSVTPKKFYQRLRKDNGTAS
jgi:hypothetical protein